MTTPPGVRNLGIFKFLNLMTNLVSVATELSGSIKRFPGCIFMRVLEIQALIRIRVLMVEPTASSHNTR